MNTFKPETFKRTYLTLIGCMIFPISSLMSTASAMELQETVEDAIMHNPEVREQIKAYRAIQAELEGAKGSWYPTIDLSAGIGYEEVDRESVPLDNTGGDGLTRREGAIRLTENIFEGFATENEIKRQQHRLDAASYQVISKANQIALDMTEAYINLVKEKELVKLSEDNVETHQKILDQIIQRREAGIGNQVEVDQAQARLALAKSNLMAEKNNYSDTLSRFQRVLGRLPDSELIPPTFEAKLPATQEEAIDQALLNHPTIRSANADIAEAQAQYDLSKAAFYPRIDLEVERTYDHNLAGIEGRD